MKAKILDERQDDDTTCYLCSIVLEDYIRDLPESYQSYEIQRGIVSNVYLDHLVDTVLARRHIPPIVLVTAASEATKKGNVLEVKAFKILDGLQRTFRLRAIHKTIEYCCENLEAEENYLEWTKFAFSRAFSNTLREFDSTTDILRAVLKVFKKSGADKLRDTFCNNRQWFEIWTGLDPDAEVRKMLTLNAGHKPVKTRHQLELLFLNLLPDLKPKSRKEFKLVRDRDIDASHFSKTRAAGTFHFAHIITSLLSLYEGKPVAPSASLIQSIQSDEKGIDEYSAFITKSFLSDFISFLLELDVALQVHYGDEGILWMGREVSLAGLCGAIGATAIALDETRTSVMNRFLETTKQHPKAMNLVVFEKARNNLDLSKVNFGNVNRGAVFSAVNEFLSSKSTSPIDWPKYFVTGKK
jgi:hypothetical protein